MGKISIFNYEIFYLDYLEGRLGEDDIRMLMEFFEEHPECKLDDPDLPVLNVEDNFVFQGKADLKQTEDSEAITLDNVEHFMISDSEGIISDEKREELNQVVSANSDLEKDRNRYGAVYFAPDMDVTYQNKEGLKRRKTIVLWPYISVGIAAAVIGFVLLINGDGSDFTKVEVNPVAETPKTVTPKNIDPDLEQNEVPSVSEDDPVEIYTAVYETTSPSTPEKKPVPNKYTPLKHRSANSILRAFDKLELAPVTRNLKPNIVENNDPKPNIAEHSDPKPIFAANTRDDRMENPIQPITSFISKKAKTDVDFGRKKATKKEKGGFFFKVGKFEISRNKH